MSPAPVTLSPPKIISLIPSATEIVAALGKIDCLIGRSHECDYPGSVVQQPICTAPKFDPDGSSAVIHDRVSQLLQSALSVYRVRTDYLEQLQPTHIITQSQCEVCAVSLADVEQAVAELTTLRPQIVSLQPNVLADVWDDIRRVAAALSTPADDLTATADRLIHSLEHRVAACARLTQGVADRPRVACIEWIDPLMAAGNWIPELVQLAGGDNLFGTIGQHSPWLQLDAVLAANPDRIIFMPCGFDLDRTRQEAEPLLQTSDWQTLTAVKTGQVYVTDGNHYFNRPGPRLVESLEILAEILHPDTCNFGHQGVGWVRLSTQV